MNKSLLIEELRHIAELPNSFDRNVLLRIQENIACDVMQHSRAELSQFLSPSRQAGASAATVDAQRRAFFVERMNLEYRSRADGIQGFNLPLYLETAENHYRLEIRRHLQQVQDYIAHGRAAAEVHQVTNVRELRQMDPGMSELSNKVAEGLNSINHSLERLARIRTHAAEEAVQDLQREVRQGFAYVQTDGFAASMLIEAQNLADAQRELNQFESDGERNVPR
jgi:hypothetical protein